MSDTELEHPPLLEGGHRDDDPLPIFSSREFLGPGQAHAAFLHPFWGIPASEGTQLDGDRFKAWGLDGSRFLRLVREEEAAVFVAPGEWRQGADNHGVKELEARARRRNRPLVVFFNSDSTAPVGLDSAIVFRTSIFRSTRRANEHAMPAWSADFLEKYAGGRLSIRPKAPVPSVGYTGYVDWFIDEARLAHGVRELTTMLARRLCHPLRRPHPGRMLRGRAVRRLAADGRIATNFVIRDSCRTGSASLKERFEYAQNILQSDYCLVCRGGGNFSYRLFEVLSCGRIPLLINTDCVLPCEDSVAWDQVAVVVEARDIDSIADILLQAHIRMTPEEFRSRQRRARESWERWLCPTAFFAHVSRRLRDEYARRDGTAVRRSPT